LVIILIAFFSGIFAQYRQKEPCPADLMENRIIAGFYKKSFFYFVDGEEEEIQLDPKTLFGDIEIPATANYTINRLVPVNGNRVIIFFEQSDKLFYAFYELDDLTYHAKNGSARVLQSLHSQEKHEAKFVGGCDVRKEEFGRTMKRDNDKLVLGVKKLQGIDLTFCNSRFDIVFDRYSYTGTMSFYVNAEDEGKNEECSHSVRQEKNAMLTCINGQTVDFDLVLVNYRRDFRHYDHSEM
uniref:LAM_G_DOMAIN domain-containing protein n=1 Tax=Steinernema glaseri TaxID=37863 RepID=A0A1I8ASW8_9BILA